MAGSCRAIYAHSAACKLVSKTRKKQRCIACGVASALYRHVEALLTLGGVTFARYAMEKSGVTVCDHGCGAKGKE